MVTFDYWVISSGYLVVTSDYLIAATAFFLFLHITSGYFLSLIVPRFNNNE